MMTKDSLINFIHIPKTAGSTFIDVLKRNFKEVETFPIDELRPGDSLNQLKFLSDKEINSFQLLMGHWSLKAEPYFGGKEITRILFLREPIRHFMSTYEYIKQTKIHEQYSIANSMPIDEFLDFRKENRQNNLQTQHLASIASNMTKGIADFDMNGDNIYKTALAELKKTKFTFLTDKFEEALAILKANGLIRDTNFISKNVSIKRKNPVADLKKSTIDKILIYNKYNVMLY